VSRVGLGAARARGKTCFWADGEAVVDEEPCYERAGGGRYTGQMTAFRRLVPMSAPDQVKSVDLDLSMSGKSAGAAFGFAQSYTGTRLTPVVRLTPNRTLNGVEAEVERACQIRRPRQSCFRPGMGLFSPRGVRCRRPSTGVGLHSGFYRYPASHAQLRVVSPDLAAPREPGGLALGARNRQNWRQIAQPPVRRCAEDSAGRRGGTGNGKKPPDAKEHRVGRDVQQGAYP
jgi:hypothetical protein